MLLAERALTAQRLTQEVGALTIGLKEVWEFGPSSAAFDHAGGVQGHRAHRGQRGAKAALEGERKQVTVLFADLKGSMELLADCDPEEARKLLDPVLEL